MKLGGFYLEEWDLWDAYNKLSPSMVKRELWKEKYRALDHNWPKGMFALRISKMAFVLQKQVPDDKRLTKEEMLKFLDF